MLGDTREILREACRRGRAVPSPDCVDLDSARTFVQVAEELGKPIILAFGEALEAVLPLREAAVIGRMVAENVRVPVALHLDHGTDLAGIRQAVDLGFTSVMIDASDKSFEENVALTREIVDYAHPRGVAVEAELGHVGQGSAYTDHEHSDNIYTEPQAAVQFVRQTGVDLLAVSIGTAHGVYRGTGKPQLDFSRLQELKEAVSVPLVLHGGSGTGDDNLARCAQQGIAKINLFTDFLTGAMDAIRAQAPGDYLSMKEAANQGMAEVLRHYYSIFG